jgi:hypothetical protein
MTLLFDGIGQFHMIFTDPRTSESYDFAFNHEDTEQLALFLHHNAHVAEEAVWKNRMRATDLVHRKGVSNGSTDRTTTDEG